MRCPPLSGLARLLTALLGTVLGLASPAANATPKPTHTAASAPAPSTAAAKKKTANKKAPAGTKTAKGRKSGAKTRRKAAGAAGAGAAAAAATAASDAAAASSATPAAEAASEDGVRLPLMMRVTPALPDNVSALRARLEGVVSAQGESAQGATVDNVSQLGPDIYAFALRCVDAAQCQRLRLAIESERDWVAGLQLDERRHLPRAPQRHSPSAR